jgi:hypothetical protein
MSSAAAMNVLKTSGGHISGMSNHHNMNGHTNTNDRHHYRGPGGSAALGPGTLNGHSAAKSVVGG